MQSCKQTKELLSAYYDGELGVAASKEIEEHLLECSECREELEEIKKVSEKIKSLDFPVIDENFSALLRQKLDESGQTCKKKGQLWTKISPYVAVAACFALATGIYVANVSGKISPQGKVEPISVNDIAQAIEGAGMEVTEGVGNGSPEHGEATPSINKKENLARKNVKEVSATILPKEDDQATEVSRPMEEKNTDTEIQKANVIEDESALVSDAKTEGIDTEILPDETQIPATYGIPAASGDENNADDVVVGQEESGAVVSAGGSGGGSALSGSGIVAKYRLENIEKLEQLRSILKNYGDVTGSESYIKVKILSANYGAALDTLKAMSEIIEVERSGDAGAYGYIEIEYENTVE